MPSFALERFEQQAEAFARARARRRWEHLTGQRASLQLETLYGEDFPALTSNELYADLHDAPAEDEKRRCFLEAFLVQANLEGHTRELGERAARLDSRSSIRAPGTGEQVPWRAVPPRWANERAVAARHELNAAWREALRADISPILERWLEALRQAAMPLGDEWLPLWERLTGGWLSGTTEVAERLLVLSADVYAHTLRVYLGQLELPLDDAWEADAEHAFRAPQLDRHFPRLSLMPTVVRALRDLGIELEEQRAIRLELQEERGDNRAPGVHVVPLNVPDEVRVAVPLGGGHLDYARTLDALGQAEHFAHADPGFPFAYRWLGDPSTTLGYGLLLESLTREPSWLRERLGFAEHHDFRVIATLAQLYRVRRDAALAQHTLRLWAGEGSGGSFVDLLSGALRVRPFAEERLLPMLGAPWEWLAPLHRLRAALFAAQTRLYLRREFDEEWYRDRRAGRFLVQELWRPGRRFTAEELLGYMGYDGLDPAILWREMAEVLGTV